MRRYVFLEEDGRIYDDENGEYVESEMKRFEHLALIRDEFIRIISLMGFEDEFYTDAEFEILKFYRLSKSYIHEKCGVYEDDFMHALYSYILDEIKKIIHKTDQNKEIAIKAHATSQDKGVRLTIKTGNLDGTNTGEIKLTLHQLPGLLFGK